MSDQHKATPWWENYWQFLVIAFGILFVTLLVSFHPMN
jgi:hypothetical protein